MISENLDSRIQLKLQWVWCCRFAGYCRLQKLAFNNWLEGPGRFRKFRETLWRNPALIASLKPNVVLTSYDQAIRNRSRVWKSPVLKFECNAVNAIRPPKHLRAHMCVYTDHWYSLSTNHDFVYWLGMCLRGLGKFWGAWLDDFWADVWYTFGTCFVRFGDVIGKVLGICLEGRNPMIDVWTTSKTFLEPTKAQAFVYGSCNHV